MGEVEVLLEVGKGWAVVERLLVERGDMDYLVRFAKKKMNGEVFIYILYLFMLTFQFIFIYFSLIFLSCYNSWLK